MQNKVDIYNNKIKLLEGTAVTSTAGVVSHHLHQVVEGSLVIVKHQHVFSCIHQLHKE